MSPTQPATANRPAGTSGIPALAQRVLAAAVGIPVIVALIWAGGDWYVGAVCAALAVGALEFQHPRFGWLAPMSVLAAIFVSAMAGGAHTGPDWVLWFLAGGVIAAFALVLLRFDAETALLDWMWTAGALLYVGMLGSFFVLVRDFPDGRDWAYMTVFATFAIDTGAYFTGRAVGRRLLAPRISPKKTVEGFVGGYVAGIVAAVLLNYFLGLRITAWQIAVLAIVLPLAATVGDLSESAIKRSMHIKDTSEIIPGHGGILDRFASLLFTFTVVYLFQQWIVS